MTTKERELVFQTIELLRKTASSLPDFANDSDWKDVDDWLFAGWIGLPRTSMPFTMGARR